VFVRLTHNFHFNDLLVISQVSSAVLKSLYIKRGKVSVRTFIRNTGTNSVANDVIMRITSQ